MKQFFETYTIQNIVVFLVLLSLAVKELLVLWDWFKQRFEKGFLKNKKEEDKERDIIVRMGKQEERTEYIMKELTKINSSISLLLESDKDNIKSWIVEQHRDHFCDRGYIDEYALDCIERRYEHYRDEGGNSYVEHLMNDIRGLLVKVPEERK